jgi:hypothetical protein
MIARPEPFFPFFFLPHWGNLGNLATPIGAMQ